MKHAEIKQHILETASDLFYTKGYNNTGINEIIATSGIAKATLYNHFESKEVLCLAYLVYKNSAFLRDIANFCKVRGDGGAQILGMFDYLKNMYRAKDFSGCWCLNTVSEIPTENVAINAEIRKQKKLFITFIKNTLTDNFELLAAADATVLARKIYLLFEAAWAESHLHGAEWPIKEARVMCSTFFV